VTATALTSEPDVLCSRYWALLSAVVIALLSVSATAKNVDLPAATSGFDAWTSVVAKAMSFGGKDKEQSLQALDGFQEKVMKSLNKQVTAPSRKKLLCR
jgi:hypothetical protein